ncbi:MAG: hypothetical protein U1C74_13030 [Phenylobacterium sp.]|nr:hypothetical protein [Phenylobacterium sp.]
MAKSTQSRMVAGGLAALAVMASSASAQGLADTPPTPALEKAGWTLITASDNTWVYMRAAGAADGGVRRVWTAYDSTDTHKRDGFEFRSVRSLGEYDCRRKVSRVLDEFYHDGTGLTGRTWRSPMFRATPWAAAAPNSVGAVRMAFACRALVET